jgi:hypothetical protein
LEKKRDSSIEREEGKWGQFARVDGLDLGRCGSGSGRYLYFDNRNRNEVDLLNSHKEIGIELNFLSFFIVRIRLHQMS